MSSVNSAISYVFIWFHKAQRSVTREEYPVIKLLMFSVGTCAASCERTQTTSWEETSSTFLVQRTGFLCAPYEIFITYRCHIFEELRKSRNLIQHTRSIKPVINQTNKCSLNCWNLITMSDNLRFRFILCCCIHVVWLLTIFSKIWPKKRLKHAFSRNRVLYMPTYYVLRTFLS